MSVKEIREAEKKKLAIFGAKRVIDGIKIGKVASVYLAGNAPKNIVSQISETASVGGVKVKELKETNEELGSLLKKLFSISVVGVALKKE